jgi:hypothetical protein
MRKDKQQRLDRFASLIEATIKAGDPRYVKLFEGFSWAAMAQTVWSNKLGISDRTLRDLAKCGTIVRTTTVNGDGKPVVLYRLGSTPHKSPRHIANTMAALYRKHYDVKRVPPRSWGCLVGLAGVWPSGVQVNIFRMLLDNLKAFMAAVKAADPDCTFTPRFYEFLPITLVRKYPDVALQLYVAGIQEVGQKPHASIVAMFPKLWPKQNLIG